MQPQKEPLFLFEGDVSMSRRQHHGTLSITIRTALPRARYIVLLFLFRPKVSPHLLRDDRYNTIRIELLTEYFAHPDDGDLTTRTHLDISIPLP